MKLKSETMDAIREDVLKRYPHEAVGYVVDDIYIPVKNISDTPETNFKVDGITQLEMREKGNLQALIHSHPYKLGVLHRWPVEWPSSTDIENHAKDPSIAWGIVATEGEGISEMVWMDDNDRPSLEGRQWKHGITDCYALIRDYYWFEHGIFLKDYARDMEWWAGNQNLYEDNFEKEGFEVIDPREARVGDLVLMRYAARMINHAAVITGVDEILHHQYHKLSGKDGWSKWHKSIVKYARHKDLK